MSLVTAIKVSLNFVERQIFNQIGLQINPGDRIGLVGPNGSGKTTLLRVIMGKITPDEGEIRIAGNCRIGYLAQDVQEAVSGSLLQSVLGAIPQRLKLEKNLKKAERSLEKSTNELDQNTLGKQIANIHQEINRLKLEFPHHEAEKILLGLGFDVPDFQKPVSELSGGWKMRAALARLLYQKPDLLLLDEPTNHLDMPSVRWLETFLQSFKGAMILVSHDREFLNRQIHRIVSFETEGMRSYSGNYDFYLKARREEVKSLENKARNQEQKVKDAQKFIERFRSKANKARQAQSKIKLLEKMALIQTHRREKTIRFAFPPIPRSGGEMVAIRDVSKWFGDNILYEHLNLRVTRGERIAIIGSNGCGKTTLLRAIAGELKPDRGEIVLGHKINVAYFAQHHSDLLNPQKTVVEEVYQSVPGVSIGFVRSVCGAFLFSGDDVDKPISVLSGGERARVSLAKLLVKPGNFMLMDEPTNHLDIESSETLIDALSGYGGTLLFVSHNQSFVNRLATKIWDIRGRELIEYPGTLKEYYRHLVETEGNIHLEPQNPSTGRQKDPESSAGKNRKKDKRKEAEQRQRVHDILAPIRKELEQTETAISQLETRQKEVENLLADPKVFEDSTKSVPLLTEHKDVSRKLESQLERWEGCHNKMADAKANMGI
ncbi:MAG: ABC-F family ATP-binding cassette domain-containing protein [Deltaproteobacteria bacterium]|nr:ABC-F family ATP-binding cassette domain-containing protein [Deltaproteobacteria bacterium]